MKLKYLFGLLVLILTACGTTLTDDQKNADAVYLKQVKEYTLNKDGSSTYHYYHKLLYNSYLSINRLYGETFVVYNPEYQTLKVNKSETTMADGKKVKSPENAYNEALPFAAADAPAYNYLREMVITHVGLERGAVVELDYVIQSKIGFQPFFADRVNLCETSPVKDEEIIVRIPKDEKLNVRIINQPEGLKQKETIDGDYKVYTWKTLNLKAYNHEPLQLEGYALYPFITFSTADLPTAFNYLKGNLTNTFIADEASKKLINNEAKGWEKVNLIRDHVASNMNTYGVQPQLTGYRFRSPEEVWQSNGGTEGEKAILLAEMLKIAGFNAQPVVAGYSHFLSNEIGYLGVFDKYYVKVDFENETRFFSVNEDHSKVPGQRITIALNDDISKLSFEKAAKPDLQYSLNAEITIATDGKLTGTGKVTMNAKDENTDLLSGIPSSAYKSTKTNDSKELKEFTVSFTKPDLAEKIDGHYMLNLPCVAQGVTSIGIGELPLSRSTSIELMGSYNESYSFSFTLPKGFKIISPVNKTAVENGLGSCNIEVTEKDGKVIVSRNIDINKAIIPAENYNEFRQIMSLWTDKNLNKVVIKAE